MSLRHLPKETCVAKAGNRRAGEGKVTPNRVVTPGPGVVLKCRYVAKVAPYGDWDRERRGRTARGPPPEPGEVVHAPRADPAGPPGEPGRAGGDCRGGRHGAAGRGGEAELVAERRPDVVRHGGAGHPLRPAVVR